MLWLKWALIAIAICVFLLLCDRLLLWMEQRGWIYYRKKKASPGTAAGACLEIQKMIEPGTKHILQVERKEHEEEEDEGAPT